MDKNVLLQGLFDSKVLAMLRLFFDNPEKQYILADLSSQSKVSMTSAYRIVNRLVGLKLVQLIAVNKFKLYQLASSEEVTFLSELLRSNKEALQSFVDEIREMSGLQRIILLGKEQASKADLVLIGNELDRTRIKNVISEVRDKYNYTITYMDLTEESYVQLRNFGQFSGERKVLFQKEQ